MEKESERKRGESWRMGETVIQNRLGGSMKGP
jgi:hypothetical protein